MVTRTLTSEWTAAVTTTDMHCLARGLTLSSANASKCPQADYDLAIIGGGLATGYLVDHEKMGDA
jgi:hypothetical protein